MIKSRHPLLISSTGTCTALFIEAWFNVYIKVTYMQIYIYTYRYECIYVYMFIKFMIVHIGIYYICLST